MASALASSLPDTLQPLLYIGGEWTPARGGRRLPVENPATGEVIAEVADADPSDGLRALDAAATAQASWAATAPRERSELLDAVFQNVRSRLDEFAGVITSEMGKPLREARGEVNYANEFLRWYAEEAVRISGRYGPNPSATGTMIVSKRPVGPCYLITPWNFPLAMATRKIAPALAAGCTAVIKPAALTPLTTLLLTDSFAEAGLPAGVLNVVTTSTSSKLTDALLEDDRLRKVSFTGSTPVGIGLMQKSASKVLRTSMELGGNAPFVVFEDADIEKAVTSAMTAKFRNMGQACTAANRFLVHESVAVEFSQRLAERVSALTVGDGVKPGVDIGPLIDDRAVTHAVDLIADAVGRGAQLVAGGKAIDGMGHFFEPTIVTSVPHESRLASEEIFGPVVPVTTFADDDEAIHLANATSYGLAAYVFTRDLDRARRLIDEIDSGMMGLNTGLISDAAAPFGGVKQSGIGREGSIEGIDEYLETKYTLQAN